LRLTYGVDELRLRVPFTSAHGTVAVRSLVWVGLTAQDGVTGFGEAAPLQSYDGVSTGDVLSALERWRPLVEAGLPVPEDGLPQARAALDLASWDLKGRRAGEPVWRLLGAAGAGPVAVNATIGASAPAQAAQEAAQARAAGFRCVKVKAGVGEDLARVAAVRAAAGPAMGVRLDANGAWSPDEAVDALRELAPLGIELCEEPVHGAAGLAAVAAASRVPVSADESAGDPGLYTGRVCSAVCLKIAASGGISGLLRDAARARSAGYEVYLASTLDGPLGIAAALHAATVIAPDRPCGLATLALFDAPDALPPTGGAIHPPTAPGLGVGLRKFS
jgi:L-alanine-DL-glutamate epimerase-like enolase superfamily enzyme